jgi:hypothetical protein
LIIYAEDIFIEEAPDRKGFHLFIRKTPGISSVLLTESAKDYTGEKDSYAYESLEWNEINGGRLLMDSSPEDHPRLGEVFHIYIPSIVTYGFPNTRHATLTVEEGFFVNIRSFDLPDYSGEFKDNPFILTRKVPGVSSPPQIQFFPPDSEPVFPVPDQASLPVEDSPPDLPAYPRAGQETLSPEPPPPDTEPSIPEPAVSEPAVPEPLDSEPAVSEPSLSEPLDSGPLPKAEDIVFAPVLHIRGGLAILFPGPEGRAVTLKNTYDPVGAVTLTNGFTKTWGFHLGFDRDPLLMNRFVARASWDREFAGLEAGPYFGLLNSGTGQVSPGLSLVLHARIPRWNLFSSFHWDSPLGRDLAGPGDYIQAYGEIKAGVTLPFGRLILSLTDRKSTVRDELGIDIISHWIRYNLAVEITPSSIPFGVRFDLGYQRLRWNYYLNPRQPLDYCYYHAYAGIELSWRIGSLTLLFGVEAPVYPFTYSQIGSLSDPQSPFLGQITLGLRWVSSP